MDFLKDAQTTENLHIEIPRLKKLCSPNQTILSFGSCFAQNLQAQIAGYGLRVAYLRDICGHYSTGSIAKMINRLVSRSPIEDDDLFHFTDTDSLTAYDYMLKRRYHGASARKRLTKDLQTAEARVRQELQECDFLTLTLGTSRVIKLNRNDRIINAASGITADHWYSEMLSVEQNIEYLEQILSDINSLDRSKPPHVIITISPQRYLFSQGVEELEDTSPFLDNMLAKSILRVAVEKFVKKQDKDAVSYFPSFEIVMEELRLHETISTYDYCHIEQSLTPKYVVKRFLQTYCSDEALTFLGHFEKAAGIYGGICANLENGMDANHQSIKSSIEQLDQLESQTPSMFADATFARITIDRLQRDGKHEDAIDYYTKVSEELKDLRSHWKAIQSYIALDRKKEALKLLTKLLEWSRCLSDALPKVCSDIKNSLDLLQANSK